MNKHLPQVWRLAAASLGFALGIGGAMAQPVAAPEQEQENIRRLQPPSASPPRQTEESLEALRRSADAEARARAEAARWQWPSQLFEAPSCTQWQHLEITQRWESINAPNQERVLWQSDVASICDAGAQRAQDALRQSLEALARDGLLATDVSFEPDTATHTLRAAVWLMSLAAVDWPDREPMTRHLDQYLALGEPLRLYDLDRVVEGMLRLGREDVRLRIDPDARLRTARLQVHSQARPSAAFSAGAYLRPGLRSTDAQLTLLSPWAWGERLTLNAQIADLGQGRQDALALGVEWPVGDQLLSWQHQQVWGRQRLESDGIEHRWRSRETEDQLRWLATPYRDSQRIWRTSLGLSLKRFDRRFDDAPLQSQSPRLAILHIDHQWRQLWGAQNIWHHSLALRQGLSCCGARRDTAFVDLSGGPAAHAQFTSAQMVNVLALPVNLGGTSWRWVSSWQLFHSQKALYPSEQFSLAGADGVGGLYRSPSLVDRGWALRTGLHTRWAWASLQQPLLLGLSYGWAQGSRHADGVSRRYHGASLDLSYPLPQGSWSLSLHLPHASSTAQVDKPSLTLALRLNF